MSDPCCKCWKLKFIFLCQCASNSIMLTIITSHFIKLKISTQEDYIIHHQKSNLKNNKSCFNNGVDFMSNDKDVSLVKITNDAPSVLK